ncbi:hypothetical protein [Rubinisphaera italica]|uniref:Glycosyl hydrolases family 2, sugar binding domain n=1 Tax=Rubinisphaera italica TaxID=2527969 RepID=A0A5C5XHY2_9PLAN|nr:hypothetical protein [Rubinisphaera italica]TWT62329.1 hypothetical protein Pan54_30700 [Rubinisphaera italica]
MSHSIRLIGPWIVQPQNGLRFVDQKGDSTASRRIKMPASWTELFGTTSGKATFTRTFNSPTGIDKQTLIISLEELHGYGTVSFNGEQLIEFGMDDQRLQIDVTSQLVLNNKIVVEMVCDPSGHPLCGLHRPVILVIEET